MGRKQTIPAASRRALALASGGIPGATVDAPCHYCGALAPIFWPPLLNGKPGAWVHFSHEIDHVVAEHHGGTTEATNLVLACRPCNRRKGVRTWRASEPSSLTHS